MTHIDADEPPEVLHVFDFPQIHSKPSAQALLNTLTLLTSAPPSWECSDSEDIHENHVALRRRRASRSVTPAMAQVNPEGLTRYLTTIVSSDLRWIQDDAVREEIWEQASLRISERSGRSAMPAISRSFHIPTRSAPIDITIHEPALTADNLGLKTWAASYLLAKRLHIIQLPQPSTSLAVEMLELGAGTGLVGIAAAAIFHATVILTDLAEIAPNLWRNIEANRKIVKQNNGTTSCAILDWSDPLSCRMHREGTEPSTESLSVQQSSRPHQVPVILAADSLYSAEHPRLLVQTIEAWLAPQHTARVIVEFPLREAYMPELADFRERMIGIGLHILSEGEETGYDDWGWGAGDIRQHGEVRCWWSVWGRKT